MPLVGGFGCLELSLWHKRVGVNNIKGEFRSLTIYHNGEKLIVGGDKEVVKFVTEKEENLTLREIKEKIEELSQSEEDHRYQRRRSYPRLPMQFKSKGWDWKIARKVLNYMGVEGFLKRICKISRIIGQTQLVG